VEESNWAETGAIAARQHSVEPPARDFDVARFVVQVWRPLNALFAVVVFHQESGNLKAVRGRDHAQQFADHWLGEDYLGGHAK
jgi:hypothetical protein